MSQLVSDFSLSQLKALDSKDSSLNDLNNTGLKSSTSLPLRTSHSIAFVDSGLAQVEQLIAGIAAESIIVLNSQQDGIEQITNALSGYDSLSSVHIFSHGSQGALRLGNTTINSDSLDRYGDLLSQWGGALLGQADIMLYGCDLTAGEQGLSFVNRVSALTGADVAASTDVTGQGGDWELETQVGAIESVIALDLQTQAAYDGTLALLSNGDFESGLSGWDTFSGAETTTTAGALEGQSLSLIAAASGVSQIVDAIANETYTFTGSARSSSSGYSAVGISFFDENFAYLGGDSQQITTDSWSPYSIQLNADAGSRYIQVWAYEDDGSGMLLLDNLALETDAVMPPEPPAPEGELLSNSGFESGLNNWFGFSGTETISSTAFEGSQSLQLSSAGSGASQLVDARANQEYELSLYAQTNSAGYVGAGINFFDADYNLLAFTPSNDINISGREWQLYQQRAIAPEQTRYAQVWIYQNEADGSSFLDEISLSVPTNTPKAFGDISLAASNISVDESDGTATLTVLRTRGSDGEITVDYSTLSGTATPNVDFTPVSGTLTFAEGETEKTVTVNILEDILVEGSERFSFAIDNVNGGATLLAPRTAQVEIVDNDDDTPTIGNGNGLKGEYYDNINFTNQVLTRTDATVDFSWGLGSPAGNIGSDTFSVRWSGQIEPLYSETYTFQTTSDDGIRLWINNQLVIDKFIDQAPTEHTGTISLNAGERYDIRLEYYERGGGAVSRLAWSSASQPFEIIPQSQLYSEPIEPNTQTLVSETIVSGLAQPTAVEWQPNSNRMFIAEKGGVVKIFEDGSLNSTPFIDISAQVNGVRDRGLLDIALHPDFANTPYVYLLYTYDPPEVFNNTGAAGPDGKNNRAARLTRVTADASTNYTTAVPGSEVVLLGKNSTWDNFNGFANSTTNFSEPPAGVLPDGTYLQDILIADSESHTIGAVEFGPDGALYVTNGDGTSYNRRDPRTTRVQDVDSLSGKVLRIDPITGAGLLDNPFFNGDASANRSKVYQLGLRNPFRMTIDQRNGDVYVGDVGWTRWEEINRAEAGANFGWPYYEGGDGVSLQTGGYRDLPEAIAFYNSGEPVEASLQGFSHSETGINAIVLGDFYTGDAYPDKYKGDLFFNDLGQGIVRNISLDANGNPTDIEVFTTGANIVVDIAEGPDELLYYVDLDDGQIGRWVFEEALIPGGQSVSRQAPPIAQPAVFAPDKSSQNERPDFFLAP